ncbi:MAG: molybdenum cofactor biosynthesis protein [Acidimicrobiales bacterium]|nr:MAG: molybdenum cofactor biosynthesis protein [Acidimicrobiales bacterium]
MKESARGLRAKVLTVSDSVSRGEREDLSGPAVADRLRREGYEVVESRTVPDGSTSVLEALMGLCKNFHGLVVTTGGTGFGPRDFTPEGTRRAIDREAPGLAEAMRAASPKGRLSRGMAGVRGRALILNTPGSPEGAVEALEAVLDVLPHALRLLSGDPTRHPG